MSPEEIKLTIAAAGGIVVGLLMGRWWTLRQARRVIAAMIAGYEP